MGKNKPEPWESKMIAGIYVTMSDTGSVDYDELLREAIRVAMRIDMNPAKDDFDEILTRVRELIDAYIHSPEGASENTSCLMVRLASCIPDVIPFEQRKQLGIQ